MNKHRGELYLFVAISVLAASVGAGQVDVSSSEQELFHDERNNLLVLRDTLRSTKNLHSNWTGPPCYGERSRWYGIACAAGRVVAVELDGIQLTGELGLDAFRNVTRLARLSLRDNAIHGGLPRLGGLARLRTVDMSCNRFSGPIPPEYAASLPALARLELQDNLLNGSLPAFGQAGLAAFNVSYNFLEGPVPDTPALRRFPESAFGHNLRLCGAPVGAPCRAAVPSSPAPNAGRPVPLVRGQQAARPSGRFGLTEWSVVVIAVGVALVSFVAVLVFLYCGKKRPREARLGVLPGDIKDKAEQQQQQQARASGSSGEAGEKKAGVVEMQFFRAGKAAFDLDELFRATAEMVGKGRLGITYRVTLAAGQAVVVKRLRNLGRVGGKEFAHNMQLLGRLRHENVVEVLACHFSPEERLVIYEHVPGCSLFHILHENRGEARIPLRWPARLAIAKGMARGLAYLHQCLPSHKPPHGHLKSSNVLLHLHGGRKSTHHCTPKLTDYGFQPLLPHHAHRLAVAKCPEVARGGARRLTRAADVFCFGLVLLEVVTGKVPVEEDGDLAQWARLALSHEWSTDILDVEIVAERDRHGDMLRLTEIALACAAVEPDRRPRMADVVKMIDEINDVAGAGGGSKELLIEL